MMKADSVIELSDKINLSSILQYESHGHIFYIDQRTQIIDGVHHVKPVGKSWNGYYYICCPDCQQFEAVHQSEVWKNHKVKARCSNRIKRSRLFYYIQKATGIMKVMKLPVVSYVIDLEGWDSG